MQQEEKVLYETIYAILLDVDIMDFVKKRLGVDETFTEKVIKEYNLENLSQEQKEILKTIKEIKNKNIRLYDDFIVVGKKVYTHENQILKDLKHLNSQALQEINKKLKDLIRKKEKEWRKLVLQPWGLDL